MSNLDQVVRAMSEVIVYDINQQSDDNITQKSALFVVREIKMLPYFYRFGMAGIALYLNYSSFIIRKKLFTKCLLEERSEILYHWLNSNLLFKKKFAKLLLVLTVISVYDNPLILKKFGINYNDYLKILRFYYGGGQQSE